MPLLAADRLLETSTTSGTGPYTLGGALSGYFAFSTAPGLEIGATFDVSVEGLDAAGAPTGQIETGTYTWTAANTLARTTIRSSSNGGAAVNWPATGSRRIAGTLLANSLQALRGLLHDPVGNQDKYKVSPALAKTRKSAVRVLLTGTSIASFDMSGIRVAAAQLQATYGRNRTVVLQGGMIGGTWGPSGDLKKQSYGGLPPVRAAFDVGVSRTFQGFVDGFNVVYSTEVGASNLEIRVDGVLVQTLNCNAAQSYSNVWSTTFPTTSIHTLQLTATGTGYAPVERIELRDDSPGVYVEDATMGGVGLQHVLNLFSSDANNRAGVAISGNNGIDSVFNRAVSIRPGLIIQEHFTNDGAPVYDQIKQIMDRAATVTKANKTPLVVLTESPALDFVTSGGQLTADRERLRALLMSYAERENIVGIDWTKLVDYSDKTAYEARYFPGADKTHPTAEAYLPLYPVLADLFHTPAPGVASVPDVAGQAGPDNQRGMNPYAPDPYSNVPLPPGVGRKDSTPYGGTLISFARAVNMVDGSLSANVFLSDRAINTNPASFNDAIVNSTTKDRFGPYVPANLTARQTVGRARNMQSVAFADVFTLLVLARSKSDVGLAEIEMFDDETGRTPSLMLNAADLGSTTTSFYADRTEPRYYYVQFKRAQNIPNVQYYIKARYLDIYGLWVVEGSVPIVTSRERDRARLLGPPGYMTGDFAWDKASVGQTYLAAIAGSTILLQKTALDALVTKWPALTKHRLYRVENKTDWPVRVMLPTGTSGGLTYSEATGVEEYGDNGVTGGGLQVVLPAAVNGERYTFVMRNSAGYDFGRIRLMGNSNSLYLQADLVTWAAGAVNIGGGDGTKWPATIAITFTMPTGTQATSLGSTPSIRFEYDGPNYNATPGYLVRGESACI